MCGAPPHTHTQPQRLLCPVSAVGSGLAPTGASWASLCALTQATRGFGEDSAARPPQLSALRGSLGRVPSLPHLGCVLRASVPSGDSAPGIPRRPSPQYGSQGPRCRHRGSRFKAAYSSARVNSTYEGAAGSVCKAEGTSGDTDLAKEARREGSHGAGELAPESW